MRFEMMKAMVRTFRSFKAFCYIDFIKNLTLKNIKKLFKLYVLEEQEVKLNFEASERSIKTCMSILKMC
jgi:hypothetical protein